MFSSQFPHFLENGLPFSRQRQLMVAPVCRASGARHQPFFGELVEQDYHPAGLDPESVGQRLLAAGRYQIDKIQNAGVRRRDIQRLDSCAKFASGQTTELRE
jgi:hypothetical protein